MNEPGAKVTRRLARGRRGAFLARLLATLLLAGIGNGHAGVRAQSQAASVTLTPSSLVFGTEVVGSTGGGEPVVESVTLKNGGTATLDITEIGTTGDYSQTNDCPRELPAGASCTARVTFKPTGNGVRNGSLKISDNAAGSPQEVSIGGTGSIVNLVHIHLLLNHFPIIGTIVGAGVLLMGLMGKSVDLQRGSLVIFLGIALLTFPTYMSGSASQDAVRYLPGVPAGMISAHQNAALLGFVFMEITGAFSWFGLWEYRRNARLGKATLATVLLLVLGTVGLMANAGNLGGQIRHEEIRYGSEAAPVANAGVAGLGLDADAIGTFVRETKWVWPTLQTLHFMGLSLLLGVVLVVNLRLLGVMSSVPYATVHRLLPWGVLGFALNVCTGMCYWLAAAYQYTLNPLFYWKILFIMAAGVNAIYLTVFDEPWALRAGESASLGGKVIAASVVALWIGVIFCGIMLPFLGNAF